jgi:hypothetical protein
MSNRLIRLSGSLIALLVTMSAPISAQNPPPAGDSNADARTFSQTVNASPGIIIRVPINARGEEDTSSSEMRMVPTTAAPTSGDSVPTAWDAATDVSAVPQIGGGDSNTDSSTWGWHRWRGGGWHQPWYYNTYQPRYYWNTYNWYYSTPNYYYSDWYSNCRYYYYPRTTYYYW